MNKTRLVISLILCLSMVTSFFVLTPGAADDRAIWDDYYQSDPSVAAGIMLTPGSDESERYISWYTPCETGNTVKISSEGGRKPQSTTTVVKTLQDDYRARSVVKGLEPGKTYSYVVECGDGTSYGPYTFTVDDDKEFDAVYVTDIHITDETQTDEGVVTKDLSSYSYCLDSVLKSALTKTDSVDLLLSAGDQASYGVRAEYTACFASPLLRSIPTAISIGNHDRKHADFRYFKNQPNEYKMKISSYVGSDYWFVKGDALFLVMDSNNGSGTDHYRFVKEAVRKNPDVKWRIAMFHHDLYGARIEHREDENKLLRLVWAPICDEFGIDLCLLGHSHFYSMSNMLYNGKVVTSTADTNSVTDAKGTIYLVSGSVNRPRIDPDAPKSEKIGRYYDTDEMIYNIIHFGEDSINVKSFTVESGSVFNELTIEKTSGRGGHVYVTPQWFAPAVRAIGTIYAIFNNIGRYSDLREEGIKVSFFDAVFGGFDG